ncbi:hypothetical protein [Chitinophaga sp. MM2321]|uniref:hypothetical protein n=1 Tax=Chitinophaga sp. MM2321 TaxID=3137178 RepID=UPI0032D59530
MKKLIVSLLLLSAICSVVYAAKISTEWQAPTMNIEGTANSILSKLDKSLFLTDKQKPKLLPIISRYLQQKIALQPLQHSNETAYKTKVNSMQHGLQTKLKALLTPTQYTEFMGLKPKTYDETNVLSQLYY